MKTKLNKEMIWGFIRHSMTIIASAVLANGSDSLESALQKLLKGISEGDIATIAATTVIIVSILWSMWVKMSEMNKDKVLTTMRIRR